MSSIEYREWFKNHGQLVIVGQCLEQLIINWTSIIGKNNGKNSPSHSALLDRQQRSDRIEQTTKNALVMSSKDIIFLGKPSHQPHAFLDMKVMVPRNGNPAFSNEQDNSFLVLE